MRQAPLRACVIAAAVTLSLAASSTVHAHGDRDAISDCETRLRSEYHLSDFRHQEAEKLPGDGHKYKVTGETKVDGDKHPFSCRIENRHVTSIKYDGPEPKGMGTAQKLAVGAAAAVAAGLIASEMSAGDETKTSEASSAPASSTRAARPSFGCAKASHEVEVLICKDAELAT